MRQISHISLFAIVQKHPSVIIVFVLTLQGNFLKKIPFTLHST